MLFDDIYIDRCSAFLSCAGGLCDGDPFDHILSDRWRLAGMHHVSDNLQNLGGAERKIVVAQGRRMNRAPRPLRAGMESAVPDVTDIAVNGHTAAWTVLLVTVVQVNRLELRVSHAANGPDAVAENMDGQTDPMNVSSEVCSTSLDCAELKLADLW